MTVNAFDHVHIYAADPDASVGFYVSLLGAEVLGRLPASEGREIQLLILGGLRVPLRSNVHGNQLVPGVGGFVAVSSSWSKKNDKPSDKKNDVGTIAFVPPKPVLGSITIVDYWATWCAPCKEIDAALKAAEPGWSGVEIIRVDATGWPDDGVVLPGETKGLPVIEIFDAKGVRSHLLTGKDALKVGEIVDTLVASPALVVPSEDPEAHQTP